MTKVEIGPNLHPNTMKDDEIFNDLWLLASNCSQEENGSSEHCARNPA